MITEIQAQKCVFALPVCNKNEVISMQIVCGQRTMQLQIPVCLPEEADFTAEYQLPFPVESSVLKGDAALFQHLIWKDRLSDRIPEKGVPHPAFHFAPCHGWLNDPNGLFYRDGKWHVYFQHNPFSACWRNMHWGHAVSSDLIHWEEHDIVLHPDSIGTMYSGSAVIDHDNTAGYGKDKVLLYYTNCGYDDRGTQCLAVGDGETFEKIEENPLIGNLTGSCDRDPNLAYDPAAGVWRMAIFLGDESHDFNLFASHDLIHWKKTDSYQIPGGGECPGIRIMKDTVSGAEKWVFTEASCYYRLGSVSREGKITMETAPRQFFIGEAYAGQFFQNAPDDRSVFLAWVRMPDGAFRTWAGCMSLPLNVSLENGQLKVHPAVDVPSEKFYAERKTVLAAGKKRKLVFDPAQGTISDGTKCWQVQAPGEPFSGKIARDCGCLEYFDEKDRYAGAFFAAD